MTRAHAVNSKFAKTRLTVTILLAATAWAVGCETPPARPLSLDASSDSASWEQFFVERRIEPKVPKSGPPLRHIGSVLAGRNGNLVIPDRRARRILVVASDGSLVRELRNGPGSFDVAVLGAVALDRVGNLFIHDPLSRTVTVLRDSTYEFERSFQISTPVSVFIALADGGIVTYYPSEQDVFVKHSRTGKRMAAAELKVEEKLRIFHGRVQTGGIAQLANGSLFAVHPASFDLVHLSPDLKILDVLRGAEGDEWAPQPASFPAGLNPYDYQRGHEEWWNSFRHIGRIYALTGDLLVVTVFEADGLSTVQEFANFYRASGEVVARGLRVPHGGRIVGAAGSRLYVARNARLAGDTLMPAELHEYEIRGRLK